MKPVAKKILCLCGGVGGAKLARGFSRVMAPADLTIIINTADDFDHLGFRICPDIDTVTYNLAGINNQEQGWGIEGETWEFMDELEAKGEPGWFRLGDKDMHTHRERKQLLAQGKSLTEITSVISHRYGVKHHIVPMTDDKVSTIIKTPNGKLPFQQYFVREQCKPVVSGFEFAGIEHARPALPFMVALNDHNLSAIVICPSNPYVSIDPILALHGVKEKIRQLKIPVFAVSPIIAGKAIKGPTSKMMEELHVPRTSLSIAHHYDGVINRLVIDDTDIVEQPLVEKLGIKCLSTNTLMKTDADKEALARFILSEC